MGMDQWLVKRQDTDIGRWRNCHRLHDWMNDLACAKHGTCLPNCQDMELSEEDIEECIEAAQAGFPDNDGDGEEYTDEQKAEDLTILEKALTLVKKHKVVVYGAWW